MQQPSLLTLPPELLHPTLSYLHPHTLLTRILPLCTTSRNLIIHLVNDLSFALRNLLLYPTPVYCFLGSTYTAASIIHNAGLTRNLFAAIVESWVEEGGPNNNVNWVQAGLCIAIKNGANVSLDDYFGLFWLAHVDAVDMVRFCLSKVDGDQTRLLERLGMYASRCGSVNVLREVMKLGGGAEKDMMLITASEKGRTDIVRVLVKEFDCDPSQSDHEALRRAAARGHSDVVALLLESGGVDPGAFWERAVRDAAALGHAEVVGLLLDKTSREGLLDDQPLRLATLHQHPSIVKLLLDSHRVDPNRALPIAARTGNKEILELLLGTGRCDPAYDHQHALRWGCALGHREVVRVLLATGGCDPGVEGNYCIRMSCYYGHIHIVEMLLETGKVDVTAEDHFAVRTASMNGHIDVVQLLIGLPEVDVSARSHFALRKAAENGHADVVKCLLGTGKTWDPISLDDPLLRPEAMAAAVKHGHIECVKALLDFQGGRVAEFAIGALVNEAMVRSFWDIAEVLRDGC